MIRVLILALLLSGCASMTPRQNAENACNMAFLAGIPVVGVLLGAWACTFGLDIALPEDEEEDGDA